MTSSVLLSGDFNFLYALRALRSYLFHGTLERPWAICSQLEGISHSHSSQLTAHSSKWPKKGLAVLMTILLLFCRFKTSGTLSRTQKTTKESYDACPPPRTGGGRAESKERMLGCPVIYKLFMLILIQIRIRFSAGNLIHPVKPN